MKTIILTIIFGLIAPGIGGIDIPLKVFIILWPFLVFASILFIVGIKLIFRKTWLKSLIIFLIGGKFYLLAFFIILDIILLIKN